MRKLLLTTTDNPINPHEDWNAWYTQDLILGHDTCGLLARVANASHLLDDDSLLQAKYSVVQYNLSGKHILVDAENFDALIKTEAAVVSDV